LYWSFSCGHPTLLIENGRLNITTLNAAPFGPGPNLNLSNLAEVDLSDSNSVIREGLPEV
jgi:hypothetical protein